MFPQHRSPVTPGLNGAQGGQVRKGNGKIKAFTTIVPGIKPHMLPRSHIHLLHEHGKARF